MAAADEFRVTKANDIPEMNMLDHFQHHPEDGPYYRFRVNMPLEDKEKLFGVPHPDREDIFMRKPILLTIPIDTEDKGWLASNEYRDLSDYTSNVATSLYNYFDGKYDIGVTQNGKYKIKPKKMPPNATDQPPNKARGGRIDNAGFKSGKHLNFRK